MHHDLSSLGSFDKGKFKLHTFIILSAPYQTNINNESPLTWCRRKILIRIRSSVFLCLRKDLATKSNEFFEKCQRGGTGGGVIFNPKIYVGNFGNFKQGFLSMKLIQYSNFRVQDMFFNNCIGKNKNETHFEESCCSRNSLMEGSRYQIGWIFGNVPNSSWPPPPHLRMVPISGNHAFHTIGPSYLLALMQPYLS